MTHSPAITNIGNQKPELFYRDVAQGIEHLAANIQRLDSSARQLSQAGDEASAALLGSFADEEAAKVLILIDAVRCPTKEAGTRARTLKRWSKHLWKGIYARSCDWKPSNFHDLTSFIGLKLQPFYLDGPMGIDWIFPNEILDQRERQIYVDLVEDITETGPDSQGSYWGTPADFSSRVLDYRTSRCVEVALSLHSFGIATDRGLNHVASIWQSIDPASMAPSALFAKILETFCAVQSEQDESTASGQVISFPAQLTDWPYPLWSIDEPESTNTRAYLDSLRETKEAELTRIHHIQGLKSPRPAISQQRVEMMNDAFVLVEEERTKRIDSHFVGKSGLRAIIPSELDLDVSETPAWLNLRELWRGLSNGERVSLVALSWFTRDTIANWPASFKQAQEYPDVDSTEAENYCLELGGKWLEGYRRWEAPSGHVAIGSG